MNQVVHSRIYGTDLKEIVPNKELFKSVGIWMTKMLKQLNRNVASLPGVNPADSNISTHCLPIVMTHEEQIHRGWCLDISAQVNNGLRVQALCFLRAGDDGYTAVEIIDPNLVSEWNYVNQTVPELA
jgi:hypothetical protein